MHFAYRLLGIVARVNHRLGLNSINFLPFNAVLMGAAFVAMIISWGSLRDGQDPLLYGLIFGISSLILALFLQSVARNDIVFRRVDLGPDAMPTPPPCEAEAIVAASGQFAIDQGWSRWERFKDSLIFGTSRKRWFTEVPALLVLLETGELALLANVDASTRLFGLVPLEKRAGIWAIVMSRDRLAVPRRGRQYFGMRDRPAAQIRFRGGRRSAVVSFETEESREAFLSRLAELAKPGSKPATRARLERDHPFG